MTDDSLQLMWLVQKPQATKRELCRHRLGRSVFLTRKHVPYKRHTVTLGFEIYTTNIPNI